MTQELATATPEPPAVGAHDAVLVANVHPPAWENPLPARRYNLVVVGAGTAGLVAAAGAAGLGARVALIERGRLGGDCLNYGCVPSKGIIRAARAVADVRGTGAFGIEIDGAVRVNFGAVMERMRRLRAAISHHDSAQRFRDLGVDLFLGQGRFTSPDTVAVGGATLRFAKACIATGARAASLPIPGLAEVGFLTNESVFSLTDLPPRLAVIGAGPIGCELAQTFARLGARVTLLEVGGRILSRAEAEAAALLHESMVHDGVQIRTGVTLDQVAAGDGGKEIRITVDGASATVVVDAILVGVGRAPNVEGLGLEAAGVEYDPRGGVHVDDYLRTTNRRIFAAGDIGSPFKFTHTADAQARIVLQNALFHGRARNSHLVVPWSIYTDPEIAHVGLDEHEAAVRGLHSQTFTQPLAEVDRAILDGETRGYARVVVEEGSDRILGATVVARHAGEMISEITALMVAHKGLATLAQVIHPYPTQAEVLKRLGDAYNRTRLTPRVGRWLARWLAWTR